MSTEDQYLTCGDRRDCSHGCYDERLALALI